MRWTANDILKWSIDCLTKSGVDQPRMDSEVLVGEVLRRGGRFAAYLEPNKTLGQQEIFNCRSWIERRAAREPIHYIVGRREFWSLNFKVTPQVLIPRPETEILVEQLLKIVREQPGKSSPRILEIGTGSGNIAVAVAKEIPSCHITAVDICNGALGIAKENAELHQVAHQIRFLHSDLFETIENPHPFDIIVSNPPYIDTQQLENLMRDVKDFEPPLALDGGKNGLAIYQDLIPQAVNFLKEHGRLILEIGHDQAETVSGLVEDVGLFEKPVVHLDHSGYPRVVTSGKRTHG